MNLLLDIGNSRLKWASHDGDALRAPGEIALAGRTDPASDLEDCFAAMPEKPARVLAASVAAAEVNAAVAAAARRCWNLPVEHAVTEARSGEVINGYRDPAQLGVDRWLAILAGWHRCRGAFCLADAGSALTVDMVDAAGRHLGGLILPGLAMMRAALRRDTGGIEAAERRHAARPAAIEAPARDTASAIDSGALLAATCLIETCVKRLTMAHGDAVLFVTGGDAPRLLAELSVPAVHEPLLVLEGLAARLG